jgi:GNAT superfamily N-acetyltransferase
MSVSTGDRAVAHGGAPTHLHRGGCAIVVRLRDGSCARVRQIRASDAEPLRAGFERLSEDSRYARFHLAGSTLSEPLARYLTQVDHHDHEALVAIADRAGGVGVARYVRSRHDPRAAEAAVTVLDQWQRRGVGSALLALLAARARKAGIRRFTALMLAENRTLIERLRRLGPVRTLERAGGTVELQVALPTDIERWLGALVGEAQRDRYQPLARRAA